jgi:hypothetical protein
MPTLILDEMSFSPQALGLNDMNAIRVHLDYSLKKKRYPVWGHSPSSTPDRSYGGYHEFGVPLIGTKGYDDGGVVTPHASILALDFVPREVIKNIRKLIELYDIYGEYGFYDAVNVKTKQVVPRYMTLDQGMIMLSLANYLTGGKLRWRFHKDPYAKQAEDLLKMEKFF